MEFAVYTIGDEIQVYMYEDGHKFSDFRLTIDEAESMVRKLNLSISILRLKMYESKPCYSKPLEVVSTEHTETGLTMKCRAFTSLEQSRKLAEILPIESADMCWVTDEIEPLWGVVKSEPDDDFDVIPCWSLAALFAILPVSCDDGQHCFALINSNPNGDTEWLSCYEDCNGNLLNECYADNPIDACFEMILKLNEQKLL